MILQQNTTYFTASLDRLLRRSRHKYLRSKRFIAEICKIFNDNGFNAFLVCRVNSIEEENNYREYGLPDCAIFKMDTKFTFRRLLLMRLPANPEESIQILCDSNKFVENINAVEFPFIAFSKLDFKSFYPVIDAGKKSLVRATLLEFDNPNKGECFIQNNQDSIAALIAIYDNELSLNAQKTAIEKFSDALEKKFQKYE